MNITHLISTLLVCVGVATGNVSSNAYKGGNSFNYANKIEERKNPEPKRGQETLTLNYVKINETSYNNYQTGSEWRQGEAEKYYVNGNVNESSNLGNIYNSIYVYNEIGRNAQGTYNNIYTYQFHYYDITPYITSYGTNATINFKLVATWYNHQDPQTGTEIQVGGYFEYFIGLVTEDKCRPYIDVTNITPGPNSPRKVYVNDNEYLPNTKQHNSEYIDFTSGIAIEKTIQYTIGNIQEEVYLYMYSHITLYPYGNERQTDRIQTRPQNIVLSGYINDINYEVIDLPGLMYDVITMPFSFISQGFNLTLFPGTPYALNIGNVIITIIAVSLLMFILRKVLH